MNLEQADSQGLQILIDVLREPELIQLLFLDNRFKNARVRHVLGVFDPWGVHEQGIDNSVGLSAKACCYSVFEL